MFPPPRPRRRSTGAAACRDRRARHGRRADRARTRRGKRRGASRSTGGSPGTHPLQSFSGPAPGCALLRTVRGPHGHDRRAAPCNNCAGGTTPWGTVLSGEENFNGYFTTPTRVDLSARRPQALRPRRHKGDPCVSGWERVDPRFDLARHENEPNRFGWIVEVDPLDPHATPVKHTALGRFKHEGANIRRRRRPRRWPTWATTSGSTTCTSSSRRQLQPGDCSGCPPAQPDAAPRPAPCTSPGSPGTRRSRRSPGPGRCRRTAPSTAPASGSRWPATRGRSAGVDRRRVLVVTRLAADAVGATKMDRREDVEPQPAHRPGVRGAAPTTPTAARRGKAAVDEPNPRNATGRPRPRDHRGGQRRGRDHVRLEHPAGLRRPGTNPSTYFAGFPADQVCPISCPDNVTFDRPATCGRDRRRRARLGDGLFRVAAGGPRARARPAVPHVLDRGREGGTVVPDDDGLVAAHTPARGAWVNPYKPRGPQLA